MPTSTPKSKGGYSEVREKDGRVVDTFPGRDVEPPAVPQALDDILGFVVDVLPVVVFPAPLGPRNPKNSPLEISIETSATASVPSE